jgi:hypothetical protein
VFLANRVAQNVLGIPLPEPKGLKDCVLRELSALKELVKLSVVACDSEADDEMFKVTPKKSSVVAIDAGMQEAAFAKALARVGNLLDRNFADTLPDRKFTNFKVPGYDRSSKLRTDLDDELMISDDEYPLSDRDFVALKRVDGTQVEGLYVATAETGLLHFARRARENTRAFTYSVTPKDRGDTVVSTLANDTRLRGATSALKDGAGAEMRRELASQSMTRRAAVVGFARPAEERDGAEFGWIIGPRQPDAQLTRLQVPAQHSLAALVSLPAWWNEAHLDVTVKWVGGDGEIVSPAGPRMQYKVDLPIDYEPLETMLLEVQQLGPEIIESRLDPIVLTSGREGAIVIPGRRLWRSTRVTLGYQVADEITVLPNMKGIIARFKCVEKQASLAEENKWNAAHKTGGVYEVPRAVRVWTSQGSITLPNPARISIDRSCQDDPVQGKAASKDGG